MAELLPEGRVTAQAEVQANGQFNLSRDLTVSPDVLTQLAAQGAWRFHFFNPRQPQHDSLVYAAQGLAELDTVISLAKRFPRAELRISTSLLGTVAGEGGSGWKFCNLATLRFLRAEFLKRYGAVNRVQFYEPLNL
jgi:hypothetical protein